MTVPAPNEGMDILQEARDIVNGDRAQSYGPPENHFARTIGMFNALFRSYLKHPLDPHHWGQIMVLDKLARSFHSPDKRDNYVDIAGYADRSHVCRVNTRKEPKSDVFSIEQG